MKTATKEQQLLQRECVAAAIVAAVMHQRRLAQVVMTGAAPMSVTNKRLICDGAGCLLSNEQGDDHETYGSGLGHFVRVLERQRFRPHGSSEVERSGPYRA